MADVNNPNDGWMSLALAEARAAIDHDDVPVGAVVVRDDELIAARHNERELTGDPTAHAEVLALRDARSSCRDVATGRVQRSTSPSNPARCVQVRW